MAALPVVRLSVVDQSRVTIASDPKSASFTMYTFLKSVPTQAECHSAFHDLKRHVLSSSNDSYSNAFIRPNAPQQRYLNSIETTAFTVFGRPPTRVLQVSQQGDVADVRKRTLDTFFHSSPPTPPRPGQDVPASYPREPASPSSSYNPQVSHTSSTHHQPSPIRIDGGIKPTSASGGSFALDQVIETVREQVNPEYDSDKSRRTQIGQMRNAGIDILTRLQQCVSSEQEGSDAWVAAINLQKRVHAALMFRKVQDHEQETLRHAHMALHTEVSALKLVLRDVMKCVVRSEARLTGEDGSLPPTDPSYVFEHRLFEDIQDTLTQQ